MVPGTIADRSDIHTADEFRPDYWPLLVEIRDLLRERLPGPQHQPEQAEGAPEVMLPPAGHGDGDHAAPSPSLREQVGRILATEGAAVPHCGLLALDSLIAAHEAEDERVRTAARAMSRPCRLALEVLEDNDWPARAAKLRGALQALEQALGGRP